MNTFVTVDQAGQDALREVHRRFVRRLMTYAYLRLLIATKPTIYVKRCRTARLRK